jgi:hypothetical protein
VVASVHNLFTAEALAASLFACSHSQPVDAFVQRIRNVLSVSGLVSLVRLWLRATQPLSRSGTGSPTSATSPSLTGPRQPAVSRA